MSDTGNPVPGTTASGPDSGGSTGTDGDLSRFKRWYRDDLSHWLEWREEAARSYDYLAGRQFTDEEIQLLEEETRPVITFNQTGPFIDGVCGLEINNRQEVTYLPRQPGIQQQGAVDVMSQAKKWSDDACEADDEESEAFRDMVICGMGFCQTRMDYEVDQDGMMVVERIDPGEMLVDARAKKKNCSDAQHIMRIHDIPLSEARARYPGFDDDELNADWAHDQDANSPGLVPHDAQEAPFYRPENNQMDRDEATGDAMVRHVEVEWFDVERAHLVHTGPNQSKTMSPSEHTKYQARLAEIGQPEAISTAVRRRVYKRAILGSVVLDEMDGPEHGGFTYKVMTGKRDRNKRTWYGIMRALFDPQSWLNKWISQVMHIMNTSAQSGALVEESAMANPQEFMDEYSRPGSISVLKPGGIDKWRPKMPPPFPEGFSQLMQFASGSLPSVTGVSQELIGQADRDQPGVLELHRKLSAITVLADFFDSKRRYHKEQGRLALFFLQRYIADGRLIMVVGDMGRGFIPFTHDKAFSEYSVVVDETPNAPNVKERTWQVLQSLFPLLAKLDVPPPFFTELVAYLPLPGALQAKLQAVLKQAQSQPQQPNPAQQAQVQLTQARAQLTAAQAQHQQAKTQIDAAEAQTDRIQAMADLSGTQLDQQDRQAGIELKRAQAIAALGNLRVSMSEQSLSQLETALHGLLGVHDAYQGAQAAAHGRGMDLIGAAQTQQANDAQQASQPQPQPTDLQQGQP